VENYLMTGWRPIVIFSFYIIMKYHYRLKNHHVFF